MTKEKNVAGKKKAPLKTSSAKVTLYNKDTGEEIVVLDYHARYMMRANNIWVDSKPDIKSNVEKLDIKSDVEKPDIVMPKSKPKKRKANK